MQAQILIDAMIRQQTILIAHLATAAGMRAPLAHIADQIFLEISTELRKQGVGVKVIADMFGMALRSWQAKIRRATESRTDVGRTLWEAVYSYLSTHGQVNRSKILERFKYDEEAVLKGVLNDLVESQLIFKAGRGDSTIYIMAPSTLNTLDKEETTTKNDQLDALILVTLYHGQPMQETDFKQNLNLSTSVLEKGLERLESNGLIRQDDTGWHCQSFYLPTDDPVVWGAALLDHYQSVIRALCVKLRGGNDRARDRDLTGGSTYSFKIWAGHPLETEITGLLKEFRVRLEDLWARKEASEEQCPDDQEPSKLIFYFGQAIIEDEV